MNETTRTASLPNAHREYRFVVKCKTASVLHCGDGESSHFTDAELRRNSIGKFVIPGTSIAGAMRTIVERISGTAKRQDCKLYQGNSENVPCHCKVCRLFGNVRPLDEEAGKITPTGSRASASRVTVHDAVLSKVRTRVVDGVAINRQRRAVHDAKKYDYRQILPRAELTLEVQGDRLTDQEVDWIAASMRIIANGEVGLGGRTARGNGFLGAMPDECSVGFRDLDDPIQLLTSIVSKNGSVSAWQPLATKLGDFPGENLRFSDRIDATFNMAPASSSTYLISDPARAMGSGYDASSRTLGGKPEIPDSSMMGTLRSGAERIVRTLNGNACDPVASRCLKQNRCIICELFGNEDFASRLKVRVVSNTNSSLIPFDHVAIDRFTGGASDKKKFDSLTMKNGMFKVTFTIEPVTVQETAKWMIGLIVLTLRDLHQGRIWIGKGGAKGNGLFELAGEPCWSVPDVWKSLTEDLSSCVEVFNKEVARRITT